MERERDFGSIGDAVDWESWSPTFVAIHSHVSGVDNRGKAAGKFSQMGAMIDVDSSSNLVGVDIEEGKMEEGEVREVEFVEVSGRDKDVVCDAQDVVYSNWNLVPVVSGGRRYNADDWWNILVRKFSNILKESFWFPPSAFNFRAWWAERLVKGSPFSAFIDLEI